jgi:hypothetical protein
MGLQAEGKPTHSIRRRELAGAGHLHGASRCGRHLDIRCVQELEHSPGVIDIELDHSGQAVLHGVTADEDGLTDVKPLCLVQEQGSLGLPAAAGARVV